MSSRTRNRRRPARSNALKVGEPAGAPVYTGSIEPGVPVRVHVMSFDSDRITERDAFDSADIGAYTASESVTWVNLDGVHQPEAVKAVCAAFDVHPLWVEDIVNPASRSKTELLDGQVLWSLEVRAWQGEP